MDSRAAGSRSRSPSPSRAKGISCLECRRLKRKCDRELPCNVCRKHARRCRYPAPERGDARYVELLENRVAELEDLLASREPVKHSGVRSTGDEQRRSPSQLKQASPGESVRHQRLRIEGTVRPNALHQMGPKPHATSDIGSTEASYHRPAETTLNARIPNALLHTSEALERQPKDASGYEWNERPSGRLNDGTASLSVDPDGTGYLGFAAGATMLRILQLCAGAVPISQLGEAQALQPDYAPSLAEQSAHLNAYFEHYHTQYPVLHEATFRAQWNEVIPQPPAYQWNLLLNVVLGFGSFCAFAPMTVVEHYIDHAVSIISADHLQTGSLILVQAFTLLGNLLQKINKPNSGLVYLGIAGRMAIGLGLHRELPLWSITPFEREMRAWWMFYIVEAGSAITFGRPISLPDSESDVSLVQNVDDRQFTPAAKVAPPSSSQPTIFSNILHQSMFHQVGNRCYERVLSSPPPGIDEIHHLDGLLISWKESLPSGMQPDSSPSASSQWLFFSAQKLFWRYSNLRIILHRRAFLERALKGLPLSGRQETDHDLQSSAQCLQVASDTIRSIHDYFSASRPYNRLEAWYGLHYLFHASFVPLIALHTEPLSSRRGEWEHNISLVIQVLQTLREDPLAERCLRIIDLLIPSTPGPDPPNVAAPFDSALLSMFQAAGEWNAASPPQDLAQNFLPFADLVTLSSLWPAGDM